MLSHPGPGVVYTRARHVMIGANGGAGGGIGGDGSAGGVGGLGIRWRAKTMPTWPLIFPVLLVQLQPPPHVVHGFGPEQSLPISTLLRELSRDRP